MWTRDVSDAKLSRNQNGIFGYKRCLHVGKEKNTATIFFSFSFTSSKSSRMVVLLFVFLLFLLIPNHKHTNRIVYSNGQKCLQFNIGIIENNIDYATTYYIHFMLYQFKLYPKISIGFHHWTNTKQTQRGKKKAECANWLTEKQNKFFDLFSFWLLIFIAGLDVGSIYRFMSKSMDWMHN